MPRQITDINSNRGIQTTARMADTYSRPAIADEGRIEKLAAAWLPFNAKLSQFIQTKEDQQRDTDMAIGVAFRKRLIEEGHSSTLTLDEIEKLIGEGKIEAFPKLTKWVKQGIIKGHYQNIADAGFDAVIKKIPTLTVTDENGQTIPITESNDSMKIQEAFTRLWTGYINERTGGKFDARLYAEYIQPIENIAQNQFRNYVANEGAERLVREQMQVLNQSLSNKLKPMLSSNRLMTEDSAPQELAENWRSAIQERMNEGMTRATAVKTLSAYIQGAIKDPNLPREYIQKLFDTAMLIPDIADDGAVRETLENTVTSASQAAHYREQAEEQRQKDEIETKTTSFFLKWEREGRDPKELDTMLEQIPDKYKTTFYRTVSDIRKGADLKDTMLHEMSASDYFDYSTKAWEGKLSYSEVMKMRAAGMLSNVQTNQLTAIISKIENDIEQKVLRGETTRVKALAKQKKKLEDAMSYVAQYYPIKEGVTLTEEEKRNRYNRIASMAIPVMAKMEELEQKGANPYSLFTELNNVAYESATKTKEYERMYLDKPENANLPASQQEPAYISWQMGSIISQLNDGAAAQLNPLLAAGNVKKVAAFLRKNSKTGAPTNPDKDAKKLIELYKKLDSEEQS